jgi:hypothetical protein
MLSKVCGQLSTNITVLPHPLIVTLERSEEGRVLDALWCLLAGVAVFLLIPLLKLLLPIKLLSRIRVYIMKGEGVML